jgi:hypothetical protein
MVYRINPIEGFDMKRKPKRVEILSAVEEESPPSNQSETGVASDNYPSIHLRLKRAIKDGRKQQPVVYYVRESTYDRIRAKKHEIQLDDLRARVSRMAKKFGIKLKEFGAFGNQEHGWALWKSGRPELMKAVKLAKKHNAIIVAVSTDRFVRNKSFRRNGTQPTVADFENLMALVGKVPLATLRRPDAPPEEVKGKATKRGLKASGRKPGRPPKKKPGDKKRRRGSVLTTVLPLIRKGVPIREIARRVDRPEGSIRRWKKVYLD